MPLMNGYFKTIFHLLEELYIPKELTNISAESLTSVMAKHPAISRYLLNIMLLTQGVLCPAEPE